MTDLSAEAGAWARRQNGLHRLLDGFIKRYRSYGYFSPTMSVSLKQLTPDEVDHLSALFGKPYPVNSAGAVRFRFKDFENQIAKTIYQSLGGQGVLEAYLGEPLESRQQQEAREAQQFQAKITALRTQYSSATAQTWLDRLAQRPAGLAWITTGLNQDADLAERLGPILTALGNLPDRPIALPVFAEQQTGNPHAFDLNTTNGRHLISALTYLHDPCAKVQNNTESQTQLLTAFNLERDNIANFTSFTGLMGYRDGVQLPMWRAALVDGAVVNLPLREMARVHQIRPAHDSRAYVVENSTVFGDLVDRTAGQAPLICGHGQFKLTFLRLIDLLVQAETQIWYAGDFDAEGLLMANRLIDRHPEHISPWRMSVDVYEKTNPSGELHGNSQAQLDKVTHPVLKETAERIKQRQKAGYQESILEMLVQDLKKEY